MEIMHADANRTSEETLQKMKEKLAAALDKLLSKKMRHRGGAAFAFIIPTDHSRCSAGHLQWALPCGAAPAQSG